MSTILSRTHDLLFSLAALVASASFLTAAETKDPCASALAEQVDYTSLDEQSDLAYLSIIDEQIWESKKTDASFLGKWEGFLGPMKGDFSYKKFDDLRKRYFNKIGYVADAKRAAQKLRRFITDQQLEAWVKCKQSSQFGLLLFEKSFDDHTAVFEVRWIKPPGGSDDISVTSSIVSGGQSTQTGAGTNEIFKDGEMLHYGSKTFMIKREAFQPLSVVIDAGGFSVDDQIESSPILKLKADVKSLQESLSAALADVKALQRTSAADKEARQKFIEKLKELIKSDSPGPEASDMWKSILAKHRRDNQAELENLAEREAK